jgi:hypothetical protein
LPIRREAEDADSVAGDLFVEAEVDANVAFYVLRRLSPTAVEQRVRRPHLGEIGPALLQDQRQPVDLGLSVLPRQLARPGGLR